MTAPILYAITFDNAIAFPPLHKAEHRIDLGSRQWGGWTVEVDGDRLRVTSPPVEGGKTDSLRTQHGATLRAIAAMRLETTVPLHRCQLHFAHAIGVEVPVVVPVMPDPPTAGLLREPEMSSAAIAHAAQQASLVAAAGPGPAPAPTRRAKPLPPGARQDPTPPPSNIAEVEVAEPAFRSAVVFDVEPARS